MGGNNEQSNKRTIYKWGRSQKRSGRRDILAGNQPQHLCGFSPWEHQGVQLRRGKVGPSHLKLVLIQPKADPPLQRGANSVVWALQIDQLLADFTKALAQIIGDYSSSGSLEFSMTQMVPATDFLKSMVSKVFSIIHLYK